MSYRPENQEIQPHLDKLVEDLKADSLAAAIEAREGSGDWKGSHMDKLHNLYTDMCELRTRAKRLAKDTW